MNELGFLIMDVTWELDTVLMDGAQEFASIYPLHHRARILTFFKKKKKFCLLQFACKWFSHFGARQWYCLSLSVSATYCK